jgi:hypothetical protein
MGEKMKKPKSDAGKTSRQLIEELALLRRKVADLKGAAHMAAGAEHSDFHEKI